MAVTVPTLTLSLEEYRADRSVAARAARNGQRVEVLAADGHVTLRYTD